MTANMITSTSNNHDRMKLPLVLGLLAMLFVATPGLAQDQQTDPRIGLAGGFRDAGEATKNMASKLRTNGSFIRSWLLDGEVIILAVIKGLIGFDNRSIHYKY